MTENGSKQTKGTVLVVDDNLANLRLLLTILETEEYSVIGASNGQTALMICANKLPELILLDIQMPGMDGYEVCRQLKHDEKTKGIPVIFLSALNDTDNKIKGFEARAVDYITKPFQKNEVLARVSSHTSLFRVRQELEQANIKLRELDKLKSMFISSVSHELRTPLNSIIGFSAILLKGISGELKSQQREDIERIHGSGKLLLKLISEIIDISKIEAGKVDVYPELVSLEELIREAKDNIQIMAKEKGIAITIHADSFPEITTDHKRLLQCLLNILSNAVKYSEQGDIQVYVYSSNNHIEIAVEDKGIGIPEKDMAKLFNAFERLENRLKVGGTGLGLYLTKKIATELLQGDISAKSQENIGSTFTLRIPRTLTNSK